MDIPEGLRTRVRDYVGKAQQMKKDYGDTMSEKETETWLVEPMLEMLRWNTKSPDVRKGYPIKAEGKNYEADYALMINSKPRVLIEVKKVAYDLNREHVTQLMKYAFYKKCDLSILTNGDEWRVYEPYYMKDMILKFDLDSMESSLGDLWLLSRECVMTGLLDREIDRRYAIEKLYEYIEENRDKWVSDVECQSKTFTKEAISKLLDVVIMDKNSVLGGLTTEEKLPYIDEDQPVSPDLVSIAGKYTGKSISSFWFDGSTYKVESWRKLLLILSNVIYSVHKDEFDKILGIKGKKRPYFARDKEELVSPMLIPDTDIFVEGNVSANRAVRICRQLIAAFDHSDDDLKLEIHDGKEEDVDEPWSTDGRTWHLVNMMHSKSIEELTDMSKLLLKVSDVITATFGDVTGPHWNQKYYVSFKVENTNWIRISTGASILDVYVKCDTDQFLVEDLAKTLNMVIFNPDATFSEKLNLPSSVYVQENRGRILLKLKPNYNMDDEAFRGFLESAYKSFTSRA